MVTGTGIARKKKKPELSALRPLLLDWYARARRDLPWRATRDPYAIWVSEIMLQQTRVAAVLDRYRAFLDLFPTVQALAAASEADVLAAWSGLGYYRRARMLHRAAQVVCAEQNGRIPGSFAALRELPGVGRYTAAAIASIAFDEPVAAVDGNVERVLLRLMGWGSDDPAAQRGHLRRAASTADLLLDPAAPGDWNQAMMELGATVCLPRGPRCQECPWIAACATRGEHASVKRPPMRSIEIAHAWTTRGGRRGEQLLLVERSAAETVMPGMWELPRCEAEGKADGERPSAEPLLRLRHAIMQVNYQVAIHRVESALPLPKGCTSRWVSADEAASLPLTGLTRKAMRAMGWLPGGLPQRSREAGTT